MAFYRTSGNRGVTSKTLTLAASAARTTTAAGTAVDNEGNLVASFELDVTAGSGTNETLDVVIQGQDAAGDWFTLGTFTQATGVTAQTIAVPLAGRKVRASWTVGGTDTPSFTFSVIGEARR